MCTLPGGGSASHQGRADAPDTTDSGAEAAASRGEAAASSEGDCTESPRGKGEGRRMACLLDVAEVSGRLMGLKLERLDL